MRNSKWKMVSCCEWSSPPIIFSSARINFFQDLPYQHVLSDKNLEADSSDSSSFSLRFKKFLVLLQNSKLPINSIRYSYLQIGELSVV
jgi:hypothetical protein